MKRRKETVLSFSNSVFSLNFRKDPLLQIIYVMLYVLLYVMNCTFFNNIYIRFGSKSYGQIVGIPMGSNSPPLLTDFFFL